MIAPPVRRGIAVMEVIVVALIVGVLLAGAVMLGFITQALLG